MSDPSRVVTLPALTSDPTYLQFFESTSDFVAQNYVWLKTHYNFPTDTFADFETCRTRIASKDIMTVLCLTILWTVARYSATEYLFKPFTRLCQMSEKDAQKYPESAWKFFVYLSTFSGTLYIIGQANYFQQTNLIWQNFSIDDVIPTEVRLLYIAEISFYIHSVYAVLFQDEWRKDSLVMFIHHIITLFLLLLSFGAKAHRVGVLVLLLHDGCDVIMEATKCLLTFKNGKGLFAKFIDILTAIGFLSFLSSWAVCRLYWFPLKAIYSCSQYFTEHQIKFPFMLVLYAMLWVILLMDVYWFTFIVKILVNIILGKSQIEDNREYSDSDESHKIVSNGVNGITRKTKKA